MPRVLRKLLLLSIWDRIWSLDNGGGVPDELLFIERLIERGVEVHQLIPAPRRGDHAPGRPGLVYHTYPNIFRRLRPLPRPARRLLLPHLYPGVVTPRLRRLAREVRPDLVLGFSHHAIGPVATVARELGLPAAVKLFGVMYLGREDLAPLRRWWLNFDQQRALRHPVDRYIVLDDGTQGDRALAANGVPADRISFLPNGMEMSWGSLPVDRAGQRRTFGLPRESVLLCSVSRLVRLKRIDLFLEAVARMNAEARGRAGVVIAGDGPERARLAALARRLGLGDRTVFTGALPYHRVPLLLKACDVFAATSDLTNVSMPPCEAMLCGLPVAAFDVAGTSRAVRDGETGLLAPRGDTGALARALERLTLDDELRWRLGAGAARFAAGHFMSWEERIGTELALLDQLVTDREPSG